MQTSRGVNASAEGTDKKTRNTTAGRRVVDHDTGRGDLCWYLHVMAKSTNKEREKGQQFFTGLYREVLCLEKNHVEHQKMLELFFVAQFLLSINIHVV
ncbi:hypothetical protein G6F56_014141 [Rhizopus delemar]|nr:hypothetical protein G6F56_014141 [Rhizopus delemar]